jgi:hypothetical protein
MAGRQEVAGEPAVVFAQDYHFPLLPRMPKESRPDLIVLQFWHIPWPNREDFRVCPWQEEILDGLLGNDLPSFHLQYHCNNFLDTVDCVLESKVEMDRFAATRGGKTTYVRAQPISIDPDVAALVTEDPAREERRLRNGRKERARSTGPPWREAGSWRSGRDGGGCARNWIGCLVPAVPAARSSAGYHLPDPAALVRLLWGFLEALRFPANCRTPCGDALQMRPQWSPQHGGDKARCSPAEISAAARQ